MRSSRPTPDSARSAELNVNYEHWPNHRVDYCRRLRRNARGARRDFQKARLGPLGEPPGGHDRRGDRWRAGQAVQNRLRAWGAEGHLRGSHRRLPRLAACDLPVADHRKTQSKKRGKSASQTQALISSARPHDGMNLKFWIALAADKLSNPQ